MKIVYRAENVIDASLVRGLLEQAGILAFVQGSYLQGGVGELPASGFVTVTVADDDYPEARAVVETFEQDRRAGTADGHDSEEGDEPDRASDRSRWGGGPLPEGSV